MSPTIPDDLVTPKTAARIAGVCVATVRRWVHRKMLRAWRLAGARFRVSRAEVEALLAPVYEKASKTRTPAENAAASRLALERMKQPGRS